MVNIVILPKDIIKLEKRFINQELSLGYSYHFKGSFVVLETHPKILCAANLNRWSFLGKQTNSLLVSLTSNKRAECISYLHTTFVKPFLHALFTSMFAHSFLLP